MNKQTKWLLSMGIAITIFSCNNSADSTKESTTDTSRSSDTAKVVAETTKPVPPAFTPFDVMEINHTVKDYNSWRPAFNTDSTARRAAGMTDIVVGRGIDNPNDLMVVLNVKDRQKAKDFASSPRLKTVMTKNGVISKSVIEYFHIIRFNPDSKEKQWVAITHKVKDFDAWLKVFDAEGAAARADQGLFDVVLARNIDDPNTIQLVFDFKDLAKAKKSLLSEEKKKLMLDAGVEGKPKMQFYTSGD